MKAVLLRELGGPEVLRVEERDDPQPGPDDMIVRLRAAALNRRDVWIRRGQYAGIRLPIVLGSDGAGCVAAVGSNVEPAWIGREVVINPAFDWGPDERVQSRRFRILGLPDDGTYGQLVKAPAANIHEKPVGLTFEEAAALPLAGLTAYRAVVTRAQVQRGEMVLITGIGGGVASFALLIAKALGARVFVTSSSQAKLALARELGAENGVVYSASDWGKAVVSQMDDGPDVIVDGAGGSTFETALEILKPGGRLVSYGSTLGAAGKVEVRRIFWKQLNVLGSTMGTTADFTGMLDMFSGSLRPVVDRTFPLEDVAIAHARMEQAEQFGKIVLTIG